MVRITTTDEGHHSKEDDHDVHNKGKDVYVIPHVPIKEASSHYCKLIMLELFKKKDAHESDDAIQIQFAFSGSPFYLTVNLWELVMSVLFLKQRCIYLQ